MQIQIDPQRMAAYGVGIDQVIDGIRQANQDVPAGLISNARNETLVLRLKPGQGCAVELSAAASA